MLTSFFWCVSYRACLLDVSPWQVTYVNGLAKLTGPHEVTYERRGKEAAITAERYVLGIFDTCYLV